MSRKSRKQQTVRFLHRSIVFLAAFALALFLFFYFGNIQYFLDSTQFMILFVLSYVSLSLILLSIIAFVMEMYLIIIKRKRVYGHLVVPAVVCLLIGLAGSLISRTLMFLSSGF